MYPGRIRQWEGLGTRLSIANIAVTSRAWIDCVKPLTKCKEIVFADSSRILPTPWGIEHRLFILLKKTWFETSDKACLSESYSPFSHLDFIFPSLYEIGWCSVVFWDGWTEKRSWTHIRNWSAHETPLERPRGTALLLTLKRIPTQRQCCLLPERLGPYCLTPLHTHTTRCPEDQGQDHRHHWNAVLFQRPIF